MSITSVVIIVLALLVAGLLLALYRLRRQHLALAGALAAALETGRSDEPVLGLAHAETDLFVRAHERAQVRIRVARTGDDLHAFHTTALSRESQRRRFLGETPDPKTLTASFANAITLVAVDPDGAIVAVGSLHPEVDPVGPELGIAVAESHRRRGIATALFVALRAHAALRGFDRIVALTDPSNEPMAQWLARLDAYRVRQDEHGALYELFVPREDDWSVPQAVAWAAGLAWQAHADVSNSLRGGAADPLRPLRELASDLFAELIGRYPRDLEVRALGDHHPSV